MKVKYDNWNRKYENNAEKQRAYRERHAAKKPPTQKELSEATLKFHETIRIRAMEGDAVSARVAGENALETYENALRYFLSINTAPSKPKSKKVKA
jgi:hypothetical protein